MPNTNSEKKSGNKVMHYTRKFFTKSSTKNTTHQTSNIEKSNSLNWKKIGFLFLIFAGLFALVVIKTILSNSENIEETDTKEQLKKIEVIEFGTWLPKKSREILATIESAGEITLSAEVSGTIEKVYYEIGDYVREGTIIARFKRIDDVTQISYENALLTLQSSMASAENSVASSEMNLLTAKQELEQTLASETQNFAKNFDLLRTTVSNTNTTIGKVLNWINTVIGVTNSREDELTTVYRNIGFNNVNKKNDIKNTTLKLIKNHQNSEISTIIPMEELEILSEKKLTFLRKIRENLYDIDDLIQNTPAVSSFSITNKSQLIETTKNQITTIDSTITSLESQLESIKSDNERNKLSVLAAQNRVKNSEAALNLATAQAKTQLSGAENQLRLAKKSQKDLNIVSPISGKISAKFISPYQQIKAGSQIFTIVSDSVNPEAVAYLTQSEFSRISNNKQNIQIKLNNGQIIESNSASISNKVNPKNQKIEIRIPINNEDKIDYNILVGSLVKILLPINNGNSISNLLPISAISFEPDGAEILVVEKSSETNTFITKRTKIQTGKIIADCIEVIGENLLNKKIVRYKNQVVSGEKIEISNTKN